MRIGALRKETPKVTPSREPAHRALPVFRRLSSVTKLPSSADYDPPPLRLGSAHLDRSLDSSQAVGFSSLVVSSPHDSAEKEATSTAAKIVRMPARSDSTAYVSKATNTVFRLVKTAADREPFQIRDRGLALSRSALTIPLIARSPAQDTIHRKSAPGAAGARVAANIHASMSGGEPLPIGVRQFMEPRFGADFSNVKIHKSPKAAALNEQLHARAFTTRNHVFFGRDRFQPETAEGKELIAHELTHTIQQGAAVQRAPSGVAVQRADDAAIHRSDEPAVAERQPSKIQRGFLSDLGIPDPFDWLAGKANIIPGFRMFTIILGVNPINMSSVDRSAANILRALIEFMPGGGLVTEALDNNGVFDKAAAFVEQQVEALGLTGSSIKAAVDEFVDSLDLPGDLLSPGATWDRAERIFTGPIEQLKNFAVGLVTGIIALVKEAILKPIAQLAEGTEGYALLKAVLGKDPITDEPYPPTAENILGPFLKLIGQDEIWENMQKSGAVSKAFAWFQTALGELKSFVNEIPGLFVAAFEALELEDIILVPRAFAKLAAVFGDFLGRFTSWVGDKIWKLLEIIFDAVKPGAFGYIKKTGAALKSILQNPLPFVGNLVKAAKLGFQNFAGNFLTHLKAGLLDWLTGSLPGVYIPKALTLPEFGKLALSVFGITWAKIRAKIVKALGPNGEKIMAGLEVAFDIIKALVTGGPAAAWEVIKEKLTNLKDMIVGGIIDLVVDAVVTKAVPKMVAMFIPGAGFISAIVSIYETVMVFVERISKIIQVVTAFIDSIVAIAGGAIGAAAARVESILAGLLSLAISFLASFAGLGKVADKLMGVINKVRDKVDKALDTAINFIITKAKALFAKLFGKKDKKDEKDDGELDAPKSLVEPGPGQFSNAPASLIKEIAQASSGGVIYSGAGGSGKEVTKKVLAEHPDARFDKKSKQLTLPPVDGGVIAQAGTLQALGAALAAKTGVTKVKFKKGEKEAPAGNVPIILVHGGGANKPPPANKELAVEFVGEINPIANVLRGQLTATGQLVDPEYIPTNVTKDSPGGSGITLKITPGQWNGHILPRHVLGNLNQADTSVRTVWLGSADSYAVMLEEAVNNQAVRNVVKPGAQGMKNVVLAMRGQTFNLKIDLTAGQINSFHPTGGDTAQFARLPWTDTNGDLIWTPRPRTRR